VYSGFQQGGSVQSALSISLRAKEKHHSVSLRPVLDRCLTVPDFAQRSTSDCFGSKAQALLWLIFEF
jgi:hypothetical protein